MGNNGFIITHCVPGQLADEEGHCPPDGCPTEGRECPDQAAKRLGGLDGQGGLGPDPGIGPLGQGRQRAAGASARESKR